MELIYQHWQYMWLFPHMFGFYHMCVVISTHNTVTISVVFTTEVCVFAHTCGNNHICVEKPNKQVLGFSHTGVEKHTQGLISPWANGDLGTSGKKTTWYFWDLLPLRRMALRRTLALTPIDFNKRSWYEFSLKLDSNHQEATNCGAAR